MMFKALLLNLLMFITYQIQAQTTGFYDYELVKSSLVVYQAKKSSINQLENHYNDSLNSIISRFVQKSSLLPCGLDSIQLKKEEAELLAFSTELDAFSEMANNDLISRKSSLEKSIATLISIAIAKFSEENHIQLLGAKKELFICSDCKDYTIELIDYIN